MKSISVFSLALIFSFLFSGCSLKQAIFGNDNKVGKIVDIKKVIVNKEFITDVNVLCAPHLEKNYDYSNLTNIRKLNENEVVAFEVNVDFNQQEKNTKIFIQNDLNVNTFILFDKEEVDNKKVTVDYIK